MRAKHTLQGSQEANQERHESVCPSVPRSSLFHFYFVSPFKGTKQKKRRLEKIFWLKRPMMNKVVDRRMELISSSGCADSEQVPTHGLVFQLLEVKDTKVTKVT